MHPTFSVQPGAAIARLHPPIGAPLFCAITRYYPQQNQEKRPRFPSATDPLGFTPFSGDFRHRADSELPIRDGAKGALAPRSVICGIGGRARGRPSRLLATGHRGREAWLARGLVGPAACCLRTARVDLPFGSELFRGACVRRIRRQAADSQFPISGSRELPSTPGFSRPARHSSAPCPELCAERR